MTSNIFHHVDLIPLAGSIPALRGLSSRIMSAGEAFTVLAEAADVPIPLRRYYTKVGIKLMAAGSRLEKTIKAARYDALHLKNRIQSKLDSLRLTAKDMDRLRHVNSRLMELEKSLEQMVAGMRERLEGLNPSGVEWDEWDFDIILWARIGPDPERPAYDPDAWAETGLMEPLEIRAETWESWVRYTADDNEPWGLDDGRNHSDLSGCEGHPLENFHQCYLFHELHDHAHVGLWGMLNLQSLWIEIIPHRSCSFHI